MDKNGIRKPSNQIQMNKEIKSCHLKQASQTARFRQFGRPVLDGNFLFPQSSGSGLMVFWCHFCPSKRIIKPKCSDFFFTLCSLQTHSVINTFVQSFKNAFSIILLFLSGKFCQFCTFLINKQITCLYST